jgi:hypothetical protein
VSSQLTFLDEHKLRLQQGNLGWQIWYVPKSVEKGAVWCARPLPLLNADSPEELQELIDQAGSDPAESR